jgi:E3 ubiquitin-protein ligase DOA10
MPSQLPLSVVAAGVLRAVGRHVRRATRVALVAVAWGAVVPVMVAYIWNVLFPSEWAWQWDWAYVPPSAA